VSPRSLLAAAMLVGLALGCCHVRRWVSHEDHHAWRWRRDREAYVAASRVWLGGDLASWRARMHSLDLLEGPGGAGHFRREETVRCDYVEPKDDTFSGATPKFLCARDGDTFKVKWGADNGEIYGEVAGSRLLWVLGFPTDAVYPVTVECTGCADDPWDDRRSHPGHRPPPFTPAVVERKFPGKTIERWDHQGWTWDDFERIDDAAGGAPRAHRDALKLLAAFIQHRDSKADNQRLVCLDAGVGAPDPAGKSDCSAPVMMIHDLGSAFGGPSLTATKKMNLDAWKREPVWKDARRCITNLTKELDACGGLRHPAIGEEGRQFLGRLLAELNDDDLRALFTAARVERRGGVDNWMAAFKEKRDAVLRPVPGDGAFRCPR
jgi:hypothetical protein